MRRPIWWIISLSLIAAIAAIAGIAAAAATPPPNLAKTLEAQRRLTQERPQDAGAWNDLGNLYVIAHRSREAEEAFRRAVELDPERASALFNLGLLLVEKGQHKEAFDLFERVVEREPDNAWAHYQLGAVHEALGRKGNAVAEYARAFSLDPQLALPDVNPHVIDSKLTTEAMLEAYREGYGPPMAPKRWEDPARIANMLVPPPPAEPKGEEHEDMAGPGQEPGRSLPRPDAAPAAPGTPGNRVLREGTIERGGNIGQATQPGVRRVPAAPRGQPGVRTWTRPDPGVEDEVVDEGAVVDEGEVYTPPPGSGFIYQPGLGSTGRLDVEVVPERLAQARPRRR